MRSSSRRAPSPVPVHAEQIRSGDPFEISQGRLIYCAPTGGSGSSGNQLGASVVGWDPAVKEVGVDTGYSPKPSILRAPDVAVGNVPNEPGWVKGVPELAIEYADTGQDEDDLKKKIAELLGAGTRFIWVVRLTGMRRVEVFEPKKRMRTFLPGEVLSAPGVLKNPVRVEALYDREAAERATLTNLLQRQGYEDLEDVLARGREEGREKGREEGREKGREEGREEGREKGREEGREKGREEGREKGREEGHELGLLQGKRDTLRRVLEHRKLAVTAAFTAEIDACSDVHQLDLWLDRALDAKDISDVWKPSGKAARGRAK